MSDQKEKKYDRVGVIASVSIHAILLLIFFFLLAWQAPDPPIPEYGLVVNFGTDNAGSGRVQPKKPPVETKKVKEEEPEEPEPQKEPQEEVEEEAPEEVKPEPVEETVKEVPQESVKQPEPSPVVEKKKPKPKPKKEAPPKKKTETPKKIPEKKPVKKTQTPNNSQGKSKKEPAKSNQGDKPGKTGDQGKPQGTVDSKALYGSQGGGGGSKLDLAGWNWDELPNPDENSDESGRIVFEIKVDDQGEIISVRTIEKTVSPAVEKIYRDEVENLTFHKTAQNTRTAQVSTGRITFIIKAN